MNRERVEPGSESEVIRASVIFVVRLEASRASPWEPEPSGGLKTRHVELETVIEEVLKGEVRQAPGVPFELDVRQRGTGGPRVSDFYGLWSHVSVEPGARYVAFCRGGTAEAAELLAEGRCERLAEPEAALSDTKAALDLEREDLTSAEFLTRAAAQAIGRGDVFARYLWSRIRIDALKREESGACPSAFERLTEVLENPETTPRARTTLFMSIYQAIGLIEPPVGPQERRLVRSMFRLLVLPEAAAMRAEIADVYLPNLLGISGERVKYSVDDVFGEGHGDAPELATRLRALEPGEYRDALVGWLEGRRTNQ